jgi:CPA2 family monovalent cation:H+ antiporter-2
MDHHHSLMNLAIVLAAAFIGGAVFQRLKQPALVGYIIVGIILGPSVLGVFTAQKEISLMAEMGILLLLFIAGMEIDLKNFGKSWRVSIVACAAQIVLGLAATLALGFAFDWSLERSILLGFAISLSSTAVALKILEDTGQRQTHVGEVSLGILIAQDVAVIPMLLIVGAMNAAQGEGGFQMSSLLPLVFGLGFMGGVMYLLIKRPAFFDRLWAQFERQKAIAMKGQKAITALAFCFTAAAIAGALGLSPAYGAFMAGLVIGHTSNRHLLEDRVRPIFDVLIMVFFLSVGLLIDLQFLAENWSTTLILLFITMLLKTVVNVLTLRLLGMERNDALVTGAVLAQVGEFSFILAAIGLEAHTLMGDGYKYVVALISLSLLCTPLWLYLVNKFHLLRVERRRD